MNHDVEWYDSKQYDAWLMEDIYRELCSQDIDQFAGLPWYEWYEKEEK